MMNIEMVKSMILLICLVVTIFAAPLDAKADIGFVELPKNGFENSAYTACNLSGEYGLKESKTPTETENNRCAVTSEKLLESPMNAPLEGFNMVGMISRGIAPPAPEGNNNEEFATLTDTIWWNKDTKECIFGTHILMKEPKLANGEQWEINDIVRGGFAGKPVSVAYFMRPTPNEMYGMPEVLYRAGRTFSSAKTSDLPHLKNAPANENWVDFTTDINFADPDGVTRKMTSMLYIKTACETKEPEEKEGAIRLRTTGQNGQKILEVSIPGLVPAGASVEVK